MYKIRQLRKKDLKAIRAGLRSSKREFRLIDPHSGGLFDSTRKELHDWERSPGINTAWGLFDGSGNPLAVSTAYRFTPDIWQTGHTIRLVPRFAEGNEGLRAAIRKLRAESIRHLFEEMGVLQVHAWIVSKGGSELINHPDLQRIPLPKLAKTAVLMRFPDNEDDVFWRIEK